MSSPQDPRARRRKRAQRAKKNSAWEAARAQEDAEVAKPKAKPKTAT